MPGNSVLGSAPGRVNLIGEHLDYNGGRCLPIAIPRTCRSRVQLASGANCQFRSSFPEQDWTDYPMGIIKALGVRVPLSIEVESSIPSGAGLSSSAALLCSIGVAVNELLGLGLNTKQLTRATIEAESRFVGAPTGGLDQTVVLQARSGHAMEVDFASGSVHHHPLDLNRLGVSLLVINTRVQHQNRSGGYAARRAESETARDLLGLQHLVNANPSDTRLPAQLRRRVRHVVTEQARVAQFIAAIKGADAAAIGAIMQSSHESLRYNYEVSCPELDLAVDTCMTSGALGARMTGGGFGGSAIALVPIGAEAALGRAVSAAFDARGLVPPEVFPVTPVRGAETEPVI